jgi:DNA repair exonuclease SbcCD ATPase subunit
MVGASDVDSCSAYSTSSLSRSKDEGVRRKNKKLYKNLSGLSSFARDGFCTMALSSGSKKSTQSDLDSDSDDKVRDELPFLRQENERLGSLLDNRDDMLREAKKMRKELRASLEEARTIVAELETQVLDSKLEIESLKASPVVSDEVDCVDCSIFLVDLALFKEKHAFKCEELHALRVEVAELKSRPALLGACTSCPVLHAKIDEMHAYTSSLEAKLKEPIPTSCSTCEMHALKNLELAHYVDRLKDENDELRKLMGWLFGHEPHLRMMIEAF